MTNQVSGRSTVAGEKMKSGIRSIFAGYSFSGETYVEECGPVSGGEFKLLMVLVVLATFTFGCVVHGWLL